MRLIIALVGLAFLLALFPAASARPVEVFGGSDAYGDNLSVSGTRDAHCDTAGQPCVAVSGTGTAECSDSGAPECIALSGGGDATCNDPTTSSGQCYGISLSIHPSAGSNCAASSYCLALSGTGGASCATGDLRVESMILERGCIAASGMGDTTCYGYGTCLTPSGTGSSGGSPYPVSGANSCEGQKCVDAETSGDSDAYYAAISSSGSANGGYAAISGTGDATGGSAVAADGQSSGANSVSGLGSATCPPYSRCLAASLAGEASCSDAFSSCVAFSALGSAQGTCSSTGHSDACIAISPAGNAGESCAQGTYVLPASPTCFPLSVVGTCNGVQCFLVNPTGDADAYFVAVSGAGSASSSNGVAISLFGPASGPVPISLEGVFCNDVACIGP